MKRPKRGLTQALAMPDLLKYFAIAGLFIVTAVGACVLSIS